MRVLSKIKSILKEPRFKITALSAFLVYFIFYLLATQFLIFSFRLPNQPLFSFSLLPNWPELLWRQRATFIFEPIGVLQFTPYGKLLISVPNLIIALILGTLVSLNITVSYYSFRRLALRGAKGFLVLLGTIPALLSGAACCVPILILVLGLQLTASLAAFWAWSVPLGIVILLLTLAWSLNKIKI